MSHLLVRCPFCTKRFNITGISPGTRLRCGGCQAVLTVPGSGSLKASNWPCTGTTRGSWKVAWISCSATPSGGWGWSS